MSARCNGGRRRIPTVVWLYGRWLVEPTGEDLLQELTR